MRKLPPRVKRSLPPFPSKALFNKSIVTVEKRRIAIERFFRALLLTNFIKKRMYFLRPLRLDKIPVQGSTVVESARMEDIRQMTKRTKSVAYFPSDELERFPRSLPGNRGLPVIEFASPTLVSSLRPGAHRNVIPQLLGDYTLHWKLADCLEPQTSLYFASGGGRSFSVKVQHQEQQGQGTIHQTREIHLLVSL